MSIPGIDLSNHQPIVNFSNLAAAGIKFGFFKATEGEDFKDKTFAQKWRDSKSAGILRGSYHFFRASREAQIQADNFLQELNAVGGIEADDFAPVLDIEVTDSQSASTIKSRCLQWLEIIETKTGRKPIIYTSPGFWSGLGATPDFREYPLWIAHYRLGRPDIPGAWTTCAIWQYTQSGKVKGVPNSSPLSDVDLNWFNGDLEGLQKFARGDLSGIRSNAIFEDLINRGDTGKSVEEVQRLLGFQGDNIDGKFGPMTEGRVVEFQKDKNLPINGIVDPATLAKLQGN
jgi:lysozyme